MQLILQPGNTQGPKNQAQYSIWIMQFWSLKKKLKNNLIIISQYIVGKIMGIRKSNLGNINILSI